MFVWWTQLVPYLRLAVFFTALFLGPTACRLDRKQREPCVTRTRQTMMNKFACTHMFSDASVTHSLFFLWTKILKLFLNLCGKHWGISYYFILVESYFLLSEWFYNNKVCVLSLEFYLLVSEFGKWNHVVIKWTTVVHFSKVSWGSLFGQHSPENPRVESKE